MVLPGVQPLDRHKCLNLSMIIYRNAICQVNDGGATLLAEPASLGSPGVLFKQPWSRSIISLSLYAAHIGLYHHADELFEAGF